MMPTRITLKLTASGLEVVAEYEPTPIDTDGEEITSVRPTLLKGLAKTRPVVVEARRACGGAK